MTRTRLLAISAAFVVLVTPVIRAQETPGVSAQDLSRYRQFQLGMSLVTVARQADISAEARVIHRRPELIQDLMWLPAPSQRSRGVDAGRLGKESPFQFLQRPAFPNRGHV